MTNWMRRNNKKFMAVFAAILMVAFILPTTFQGAGDRDTIVGRYAGGSLYERADVFAARNEWRTLVSPPPDGLIVSTLGQPMPIGYMLGSTGLPPGRDNPVLEALASNPDTFLLLTREAQRMGLHVSDETLDRVLTQDVMNPPTDPAALRHVRQAVRNLLMVDAAYRRAGSAVKVSTPVADRELTRQATQLKVGLVEFDAAALKATVSAPSDAEIAAHFETYADTLGGKKTDENPFGFGYKVPDRVKLQYLTLDPQQVKAHVMAQKQPYEWEVLARKYYLEHQADFPTAAAASTQPTTAPTTRPFAEVQQDATDRVVQPEVDRVVGRIVAGLTERFNADFAAHRSDATGATTGPAEAGYGSYAYLEQVAQDVQKQFGVLPTVQRLEQDWLAERDLGALPEIGMAWGDGSLATAAASAAPFVDNPGAANLKLLEFAKPLTGTEGRRFFFRFTAAERAHRPASLDAVRAQVVDDLKLLAGFEQAKREAASLLAQAKATTLQSAATVAGRTVTVAGPIRAPQPNMMFIMPIAGYDPGDAYTRFQTAAFDLLSAPTRDSAGVPVATIELPESGKVLVATVAETSSGIPPEQAAMATSYATALARRDLEMKLQAEWFDYDNVAKRIDYQPIEGN